MADRIPEVAIEAANRAASPTMSYRASARRAVIAAAPFIRAPLEQAIEGIVRAAIEHGVNDQVGEAIAHAEIVIGARRNGGQ